MAGTTQATFVHLPLTVSQAIHCANGEQLPSMPSTTAADALRLILEQLTGLRRLHGSRTDATQRRGHAAIATIGHRLPSASVIKTQRAVLLPRLLHAQEGPARFSA